MSQTVYLVKPSFLILVLVVANFFSASGQENRHVNADTAEAIGIIEHYGGFYYASETSKVGQYYQKFSHGLSERHSALLDSILLTHLQDTATVLVLLGDVGEDQTVGDFFYNVVTGRLFGGMDQNSPEELRLTITGPGRREELAGYHVFPVPQKNSGRTNRLRRQL